MTDRAPCPWPARRLALAALLILAGCDIDPYRQPYTWAPTGANAANLAAMVERPADLAHGRGLAESDGHAAAAAVDRLRRDKVKQLPDSTGGGAAATPGAAAPAN